MTRNPDAGKDQPRTPAQASQRLPKGPKEGLPGDEIAVTAFRLEQTKQTDQAYPLKLTQHQRATLLEQTRLAGKLKQKFEPGEGTHVITVSKDELHTLHEEAGQALVHARGPHKQRLQAVLRRLAKFFEEHAEAGDQAASTSAGRGSAETGLLFQFKITLSDLQPAIWRRIQVRDCTLDQLHEHIQLAMGWTNSHLHQFEIKGERYGDPELLNDGFDDVDCLDSTATLLSDIVPTTKKRFAFTYEYDFGDGWEHEILFEGHPPVDPKQKYPLCVEGERACPPEDCGGVWGYVDLLAAIRNPNHDEHEDMLEWIAPRFNSEKFDANKATKSMRKGLPKWEEEF